MPNTFPIVLTYRMVIEALARNSCAWRDNVLEHPVVAKVASLRTMAPLVTLGTVTKQLACLSLAMLCLSSTPQASLKLKSQSSTSAPLKNLNSELDMAPSFQGGNVRKAYDFLTGDGIVERSGGALSSMSPQAASGLIGNWIVETGSEDLSQLDVIEEKARKGRGISQYTGVRRGPYDAAREAAINAGVDPNSMDWQLGYAIDEYMGKHDTNGNSLSGWTKSFQEVADMDDVAGAATHLQQDFFRPSEPHLNRRIEAAQRVYSRMTAPQPMAPVPEVPTRPAPGMMTITPQKAAAR